MSTAVDANQDNFPQNKEHLIVQADILKLPFMSQQFDLVISLATLHNLKVYDLYTAIREIQRVGKKSYVMLESYRTEKELFNLQCWALTCESFFEKKEWIWIYNHFGYKGDYEFIYFK